MATATVNRTGSDAASHTYRIGDADGIYRVEGWYRTDDYRAHETISKAFAGCPRTVTATFEKQISVRGTPVGLRRITVLDCLHNSTGDHGRSQFAVGEDGSAELTREDRFSHHRQRMIEELDALKERVRRTERRQRQILALLVLLILLMIWAGLGPLFQ